MSPILLPPETYLPRCRIRKIGKKTTLSLGMMRSKKRQERGIMSTRNELRYTTINARNPIKPRIPPFFASTDTAPFEVCEGLAAPTLVVGGVRVTVAAGLVFATGLKYLYEYKTRKTPTGNIRSG